ncbi:hypothetical protein UFOVP538_6 [uncultured Caudovirales phage]|uniref:Transglycosylase SLT domain-containing protein n=1 Tax=uncultured Caudovirales phage TaxID=2100421 RepID=A0A6J5MVR4_9CAUD|nr:hypothetical protein UFOVP538_6 [uncultured Caudovirales phage]
MRHTDLTSTFTNVLPSSGTLRARAPKGLTPSRSRIARGVALASGIALSMLSTDVWANNMPYKELKKLANYQLTDKQYACHNEIAYRESRWNYRAVGNIGGTKQAYGLYQMKVESLKRSTPIKQFWMYWQYVGYRYGHTEYDEPNYCKALHHLKTKGWQ